jgi:hypothetical protein
MECNMNTPQCALNEMNVTQTDRQSVFLLLRIRQRIVKYSNRGFRLIEPAHVPLPAQQLEWGAWFSFQEVFRCASN